MYKDLVGMKFGKWSVLRHTEGARTGHTRFECICECGRICCVMSTHLLSGKSTQCVVSGSRHKQWKGYGEISLDVFSQIRRGANGSKGTLNSKWKRPILEFTISIEYVWDLFLQQNRRCALTGQDLTIKNAKKYPRTASLDRIDNAIGYVPGNVQWIHRLKHTFSQSYFIEMCQKVAQHYNP